MAGSPFLGKKYSILQQQADAQSRLSGAQASHVDAETGEVAANSAAERLAKSGQASAGFGAGATGMAHANLLNANAALAPGLASAEIAQRRSTADLSGAQADTARYDIGPSHEAAIAAYGQRVGYRPANGTAYAPASSIAPSPYMRSVTNLPMDAATAGGAPGGAPASPGAMPDGWQPYRFAEGTSDVPAPGGGMGMPEAQNYKKGTPKVAGKGDGKTDTTKAMLAPGEAVLNKAAAEHLGRDTIDLLNAAGAKSMGLDQEPNVPAAVPASQAKSPGFKTGTSNVPAGAGKAGSKAPPHVGAKPAGPPAKGADAPQGKGAAKAPPAKADKGGAAPGVGQKTKAPGGGVSPQMVAALAGMMGGGRGMPAPMAPPAPMQPPAAPMLPR